LIAAVCVAQNPGTAQNARLGTRESDPSFSARELYDQGRKAEKKGHMAEAYLLYSRAAGLDPKNRTYWQHSQAVKSRAALENQLTPQLPPDPASAEALPPMPEDLFPPPDDQDRVDAGRPLPPTTLVVGDLATHNFDARGDPQKLFTEVAHTYGLDCIFDVDYRPVSPNLRFRMDGVDYHQALHGLEAATDSFIVPVSQKIFIVARDTPQKRTELEPNIEVTVRLPEVSNLQEFAALITAVQQTFAVDHVAFDAQANTAFLRGPMSKVIPARAMFEDLLYPRAQIVLEVRMLEVSTNDTLTYGVQLPASGPIATFPRTLANLALHGLSGNTVYIGYSIASSALVAKMSQSTGLNLLESTLRSVDGQPATLHVGERYPILTAGYFGPQSYQTGGQVYTPPPSFTFEDLGLTMKVTPRVHTAEEVSLDLDTQYKVLSGTAVDGIPVIASRVVKSVVRLKFGDWALVAGLINPTDARNLAGIWGLSQLPVLGQLVGTHEHDKSDRQVLLMICPHLVTMPPSEMITHTFLVGTDTRPLTQF
jgi:general secretion pathway protein D